MLHHPRLSSAAPLALLAQFLVSHTEPLLAAAALLGDRPAVRRTSRLIQDISSAPMLTHRLRRELVGLHRLLSLSAVNDPDSLESAMFAMIDPSSPFVEDVCVMTDQLRAHLEALVLSDPQEQLLAEELAAAA